MSESSKTPDAKVKVKLVVDDEDAQRAALGFRESLKNIGASAKTIGSKVDVGLGSNLKSLKSLGIGVLGGIGLQAAAAGAALVGMAYHAADAFQESDEQVKLLAGSFTLLNTGVATFKEIKAYSGDVKDDLEDLGVQVGVTDDALVDTFYNVIERGSKSVEKAKELTEQMAQAGRAVPGGARGLSSAFEMIEMGAIRARNPIVGMISATGMLKGNAKSVAAQMQKMDPEERMKLAEQAIAKMGDRMKNVPLNFKETTTAIGIMWGNLFEGAGEPIVKSLGGVANQVRDMFIENKDFLGDIATEFGTVVGQVVDLAGPMITELFKVMKESSGDIRKAFNDLYGPAKELFGYIYENKEVFAQTIGDILRLIIKVATTLVSAFSTVRNIIGSIIDDVSNMVVPGMERFKAEEKQAAQIKDMRAAVQGVGVAGGAISDEDYKKRRAEFLKTGQAGGLNNAEDFDKAYRTAFDQHQKVLQDVGFARDAAMTDDAKAYARAFDIASQANDEGAKKYILSFLEDNVSLQNALSKAGPEIFSTGFENFTNALKSFGGDDIAKKIRAGMVKIGSTSVTQNFNGPITVKQDFKDTDPDRVIVAFKNKLQTVGTNRLQARTASPFGF